MQRRKIQRVLGATAGVVALLIVAAFATGRLAYSTTNGISMLPLFHSGDLAIVRAAGSYHVGEVVEYRSPVLHTTVLHRIIGESDGLYSFKGDNNDFVDPVQLPASAIVGTLVLHIPRGGIFINWIREPIHAAFAAAVIFGLIALAESRPRKAIAAARGRQGRHLAPRRSRGNIGIVVGGVGVVLLGALTLDAFRVPAVRASSVTDRYAMNLAFSYSATATPSTTYPTGRVTSGAPVFLKLVHDLDVDVAFRLKAAETVKLNGTIALKAMLDASDGWSRVLAASPSTAFTGTVASGKLVLPLDTANVLLQDSATETGVGTDDGEIVVTPTVAVRGTIAGTPIENAISSPLTFEISPVELNLLSSYAGAGDVATRQLTDSTSGAVRYQVVTRGYLTLFGHRFDVRAARVIGAVGSLLALALSIAGLVRAWRRRGTSEDERTVHRVRHELVPLGSDPSEVVRTVVDIATLTALADLADRFDVALLDFVDGEDHIYYAEIGDVFYRYRTAPAREAPVEPEVEVIRLLKAASS